ncbi:terminase small subunit [Desulfovibrio litoralis]|uniref:Terminase small subunit n=1 Tax=Desulfovibrio litoralis DSM 11393 TaxID=1121455 RepID=A0A1M7TIP0_9BACT|nr:terminase small subunit [Desulfovibrio litoralis]SHN70587.1 Terminase small subunit [Desulfovibrio litoralis DSM 11393]
MKKKSDSLVKTSKRINDKTKKHRAESQRLQEQIIQELSAIAFSSIHDFCLWNADGITVLESVNIDPKKLRVVAELSESSKGKTIGIKLHSKLKALEILLKLLKEAMPDKPLLNEAEGEELSLAIEKYTLEWERILNNLSVSVQQVDDNIQKVSNEES